MVEYKPEQKHKTMTNLLQSFLKIENSWIMRVFEHENVLFPLKICTLMLDTLIQWPFWCRLFS